MLRPYYPGLTVGLLTNEKRVDFGLRALRTHVKAAGGSGDIEEAVNDAISDILHVAIAAGLDMEDVMDWAAQSTLEELSPKYHEGDDDLQEQHAPIDVDLKDETEHYVVVGRAYGDDEASTAHIACGPDDDPWDVFVETVLREGSEEYYQDAVYRIPGPPIE